MRTLVNYIRGLFCKHDMEMLFNTDVTKSNDLGYKKKYTIITYRCKKCGFVQRVKSF